MYLYLRKNKMKKTVFFVLILLIGCGENPQNYTKAENALDAGREFINACLTGDFAKATFLVITDREKVESCRKLKENTGLKTRKNANNTEQLLSISKK